jgi:hypothetical protein
MPNHLLQWTAIRWAKEQGCWYYNFRGIPDVLEESQPMWGVYLFKSGFGGSAMRSLETHDLPYNPILYRLYRGWLDGRTWLKNLRAKRADKQLEAPKPEQQSDGEQPSKRGADSPRTNLPADVTERGAGSPRTHSLQGEGNTKHPPKPQTSPAQPARQQLKDEQQLPQPTHENESTHSDSQIQLTIGPISEAEQSTQIEPQPEPIQPQPQSGTESGEIEDPKEHIETTDKPEPLKLQPEPVVHSNGEDLEEHLETSDEPVQENVQPEPQRAGGEGLESSKEHIETKDEDVPLEPEAQGSKQAQEKLVDQDDALNEVTQKIPRIQIAQRHAHARRSAEQNDAYKHDEMDSAGRQVE